MVLVDAPDEIVEIVKQRIQEEIAEIKGALKKAGIM